ncbi:hypothetical protein [Lysobacter olei]
MAAAALVSEVGLREAQIEFVPAEAMALRELSAPDRTQAMGYLLHKHGVAALVGAISSGIAFVALFLGGGAVSHESTSSLSIAGIMWLTSTVGGLLMGGVLGEWWSRERSSAGTATAVEQLEAKIRVRQVSALQYRRTVELLATLGVAGLKPA